jgi:isoquinoline 1-oxidoreductase subunit beta
MPKLGDSRPGITRRGFLISATSVGFAMAFMRPVPGLAAGTGAAAPFEPTIWYAIDRDGIVTVNIIRAEMGQHVGTALARIVADELEADWASVRVRYVDTDPKWGTMVTGGSWSVWQSFPYLSQAGAAGRLALIEEGAKILRTAKAK